MTQVAEDVAARFDDWLHDGSAAAALVMRQWLQPAEGRDAVIFPPTYAKPDRTREEDWLGYNIDRFSDGSTVCLIDSVGSQANRIEPIFKRPPYSELVPQVVVSAGGSDVNLLDAGHRAADAIVRFSSLGGDLGSAFSALLSGNAELLAKLAPTSLVFGAWDSRGTQAKVPRIVRSVVRAFDVRTLHRSAQYVPALDYVERSLVEKPKNKTEADAMSELGLNHAPAPWTHGGIQVLGEIRRDAALNLAGVRTLRADGDDRTLALRRYILGLALISFTAHPETSLREGCELVPDPARPSLCERVGHDGTREPVELSHGEVLAYAQAAAASFGVGENRQATFDQRVAQGELRKSKDERKRSRRGAGASGENVEET